jgi:hypothetical protein
LNEAKAQTAADYAVQVQASVQVAPPKVTLNWASIPGATQYNLLKKAKSSTAWVVLATTVDTFYVDALVSADSAYEYKVTNTGGASAATGYIFAGINSPAIHQRGTLVLVVDTLFRDSCSLEVKQLMQDLNADGWAIARINASRTTPDSLIKKAIKNFYTSLPNVQAVLLLGHIAVPYSGDLNPDAHPDHLGAWPADVYYADMDGNWTDNSINDTVASRAQNKNRLADGKWDQSLIPSPVELQVSRIDFANMPTFAMSEAQLMQRYLYKNHKYKMDSLYVSRKGLVDDNFGAFSGEAFAANAWRNFPPLLGRANIKVADFMTTMNDSAYQWAYGCGDGSYTTCSGVGATADFAAKRQKGIFTMLFGSYFGDWDAQNNYLRAPLCSSEPALTACWAGRPNWYFHHMAIGDNIGYSAMNTQNNGYTATYIPYGYMTSGVHVALMGDLSLRSDYIKPARNIAIAQIASGGAAIAWLASTDPSVLGYYVYRADSMYAQYTKISGLLSTTNFNDTVGKSGLHFYMVRPCKLQTTPSGTYYNLGLGITDTATISYPKSNSIHSLAATPIIGMHCFPNPTHDLLNIYAQMHCTSGSVVISLVDAFGKLVAQSTKHFEQNEWTHSMNTVQIVPGIYFIQLHMANQLIATQQIIKL